MALEESEFSKIVKEHRATITEMGYPEPLFEEAMQELRLQGKIFTSVLCSKSIKLRYLTKTIQITKAKQTITTQQSLTI